MGKEKIVIKTPNALCLYDGVLISGTLTFLDELERVPKRSNLFIVIDFSELEYISAAVAVYIFALITSNQFYISNNIFTFKLPKSRSVRELFEGSGLSEAIKKGGSAKINRLWKDSPFVCGGNSDIVRFLTVLRERAGVEPLPIKLGAAVRETCLNIYHHAYGGPSRIIKLIWWSYFYLDEDEGGRFLNAIILDRGKGIPKTIKEAFPLYMSQDDSECIKHAMIPSITSTLLSDRGKGSIDIQKPVKINNLSKNDKLMIISNAGKYIYTCNNGHESEDTIELPDSLKGTIVQWKLYF